MSHFSFARISVFLTLLIWPALPVWAFPLFEVCGSYQLTGILQANDSETSLLLNPRTKSEQRLRLGQAHPEWSLFDQGWVTLRIRIDQIKKNGMVSIDSSENFPERIAPPASWPKPRLIKPERCRGN